MKRICNVCGEKKNLEEFYPEKRCFYGYSHKCRECIQRRDRLRGQDPARKLAQRRRYRERMSTPEGRLREIEQKRKWKDKNKEKRRCHIATNNAIKSGNLIPMPCVKCGRKRNIHAHHEDYSKPFKVTWLCQPCHGARHREINEEKRSMGR